MPNTFAVKEKSTVRYTAVIKDDQGVAIPAANLTTLKLTLYNLSDSALGVINSRSDQNVLNANQVTVDSSGNIVWTMQPADNAIADTARPSEKHRALFVFTWESGAKQGIHEVDFEVENINKIT